MTKAKLVLVLVGVLFISGCMAGATPWNKQNYAGISRWRVTPTTDCEKNVPICYELDVIDGKEKADIIFEVERLPGGGFKIKYSAKEVEAFKGQEIRAHVEEAVAKELGKVMPAVTEAIIRGVIKGVVPVP